MIDIRRFKIGDRIKLIHTDDPYTELRTGHKGTIEFINAVQVSIKWDNGSNLSMLPDKDTIEIINANGRLKELIVMRKNLCQMTNDIYDIYKTTNLTQVDFSIITNSVLKAMDTCDKEIHKA